MIQEGHILTLPAPVCGSERWAILRLVTHDRARGSCLWYATLACDLDGERRVIDVGEDTGWLTRRRRGEVLSSLHNSERHAIIAALEQLLGELGLNVAPTKIKGADKLLADRKPSASGLAHWELLERLDAWALTIEGLRVHAIGGSRALKLGERRVDVMPQRGRWRVWGEGQDGAWVEPAQILDRVIELVRSMQG